MFYSNNLKKLRKIKHCFFSKRNGFSKGIYKSLNCGRGSNDRKRDIDKNLSFVAKKMGVKKNNLLENLGKADITAHVNFNLLNEFFQKNNLKVKNIITQKQFLENMGILNRAQLIAKKMKFSQQSDLYFRIKRLLSPNSMGSLFKVILAYDFNKDNFVGFE